MRVIVGDRGTGKTTRAIEWLAENPWGILVVPDYERVRQVTDLIRRNGRDDPSLSADKLVKRVKSASDPDTLRGLSGPWAADNFEQFPRHLGDTIRGDWDLITINGQGELLHAGITADREPDSNRMMVSIPVPVLRHFATAFDQKIFDSTDLTDEQRTALTALADAFTTITKAYGGRTA